LWWKKKTVAALDSQLVLRVTLNVAAELQIVVLGTGDTSMSDFVAIAAATLEKRGINYQITPMGTAVEGSPSDIFESVKAIHEAIASTGAKRIVTHLTIDDRRDRPKGLDGKVASVKAKL